MRDASIMRGAVSVFIAATVALIAIWGTHGVLSERISHNRAEAELQPLRAALPLPLRAQVRLEKIDMPAAESPPEIVASATFYRIRTRHEVIGWLLPITAAEGYGGEIKLALAVSTHGDILGVNVLAHNETAGIGGRIERQQSNWLDVFNGHSLQNPSAGSWFVRKDGGSFDQMTGATITSRTVTHSIRQALIYMYGHPEMFAGLHNDQEHSHE